MKKVFSVLLSAMLCATIVVTECPPLPSGDLDTPPTVTDQQIPEEDGEDGIDPLLASGIEDDF